MKMFKDDKLSIAISGHLHLKYIYYINTEFGRRLDPFLEEHVPGGIDPCNMFLHGCFRQSARKGYVNYVPAPVRLEFNGGRICSREYVMADIFDLQRHLF